MSQGVWIQTQDTLLANHQGTMPLPAASITKVATSLAVLKKLGPDHRFETKIGYIGTLQNGELNGDLVIEGGADPFLSGKMRSHLVTSSIKRDSQRQRQFNRGRSVLHEL